MQRYSTSGNAQSLDRVDSYMEVSVSTGRLRIIGNRLDEFFSQKGDLAVNPYNDVEIHQIQNLLRYENIAWSRVPRTYIVLRIAGQINAIDELIEVGLTDHWWPATAQILPDTLSPTAKADILAAQDLILTKSLTLEKGKDGQHACFGSGEDLPFETKAILGRGGFGVVEKVLSLISYKEYALKRIRRRTYFAGAANSMEGSITELEVIKRLEHRHIVKFVGSYTDPDFIGLLMSPVAEYNLSDYFQLIPGSKDHESVLRSFFGCLASAIGYLHTSRVRHKDIKPQNILISAGNVLLTDFGLSRDSLETSSSATEGASGFSPRYCAPEVAAFEPRDSSSDIWSLGCVYLEMVSVLKGWTVTQMQDYLKEHGSRSPYVRCNESGTLELTEALRHIGKIQDSLPLDWIKTMLAMDRFTRPTAGALASRIELTNSSLDTRLTFCGFCCITESGLTTLESESLLNGIDQRTGIPPPGKLIATKRPASRKGAGHNQTQYSSATTEAQSIPHRSKPPNAPAVLQSLPPLSASADV